jgi:hypothetical protein
MATIFTSSPDFSFAIVFSGLIMRASRGKISTGKYTITHTVSSEFEVYCLRPWTLDPIPDTPLPNMHAYCIISFSERGLRGNTPLEG